MISLFYQAAINLAKTAEEILTSSLKFNEEAHISKEMVRLPQKVAHLAPDDVIERALILPECKQSLFALQIM